MKKIFFIGINGIGMSGLAKIMAKKGYEVYGSDLKVGPKIEEFKAMGITAYAEHKEEHVEGMDSVIRSSAIQESNPEYKRALELGLHIIKRGELLAQLMNDEEGVAIAGTHGKTTTSSMLSVASLSIDPKIVVGGIIPEINSNAHAGDNSMFIAEADESDNSFLYIHPKYSVITNIEEDHMENHGTFQNIKNSFVQFMDQTEKEIIVNIDCPTVRELIVDRKNIITYSTRTENANIYAKNIAVDGLKTKYEVFINGKSLGEIKLTIPGEHNVSNSLPVVYLALKFGVELEELKDKLSHFKGARRRFDVLLDDGVQIIDDYAHHPTEILATVKAAKERCTTKLIAIFQPHRYSRVKFLFDRFEGVFDLADEIMLLPTYAAGEKDEFGISMQDLAEKIRPGKVKLVHNSDEILDKIKEKNEAGMYLFMGAGDISGMAHNIAKVLEKR